MLYRGENMFALGSIWVWSVIFIAIAMVIGQGVELFIYQMNIYVKIIILISGGYFGMIVGLVGHYLSRKNAID